MGENPDKKRMVHYDLLRILAAFSVVMLHSAAQFWYTLPVTGREWRIADGYDALSRFGVPVFVMLSGALFLDRERQVDLRRLFRHNILRLLAVFCLWSALYGLYDSRNFDWGAAGVKEVVKEMIYGRYHLWFLPMIIGIYLLLPVLHAWVARAGEWELRYFLWLFFLFQILRTTAKALIGNEPFQYVIGLGEIEMVCGYLGYFVLGYYIAHVGIGPRCRRGLYLSVLPAAVCNVVLGSVLSERAGRPLGEIYDSFGLFTFLIVTALFEFFTRTVSRISWGPAASRLIRELSMATLGVYVMHVGMIEALQGRGIHSMLLPNWLGIPLLAVGVYLICSLLAMVLRRIPGIGRYIC